MAAALAVPLAGCGAEALGAPLEMPVSSPRATAPGVARWMMAEDPHYLDQDHLERVLSTPLRVTPASSSDELARRFAHTIDDRTDRCTQRRITQRDGEVRVELGSGCSQGGGAMTVRFERVGDEHRGRFEFEDFWLGGNKLDGTWEAVALATAPAPPHETHGVTFHGPPPFEELPPQAYPTGTASPPSMRFGIGEAIFLGVLELTWRGFEALGSAVTGGYR